MCRAYNQKLYIYELQIDEKGIVIERLQTLKNRKSKPTIVFEAERDKNNEWNAKVRGIHNVSTSMHKFMLEKGSLNNPQIGLLVSKGALLGDEDALAVVDWVTNTLYPESLSEQTGDDIIKLDADMHILEDERYMEIFRMVDYKNDLLYFAKVIRNTTILIK